MNSSLALHNFEKSLEDLSSDCCIVFGGLIAGAESGFVPSIVSGGLADGCRRTASFFGFDNGRLDNGRLDKGRLDKGRLD